MLRRNSLERRLFVRLLVIALLPPLGVLGLALAAGAGSFEFLGTLGPWERVADSGRDLIETATRAAPADSALTAAVARHERELSLSLVQASRWTFLGERLGTLVSIVALLAVVVLATAALIAARSMAASLARPIRDLVDWSDALAHGRPLPPASPAEATEVREVRALRTALRSASASIADARARDLEAERVRAWGEIARRVAHEMKNPLTPLRLASHRITRAASGDAALVEAAEVIAEETGRLDDMARQFAALGRPPEGPPGEVDVAALLAGLLDSDVPPGIARALDVAPGALPILAHYDTLLRAFRNLVRNAVESIQIAAPPGGAITVRVSSTADGGIDVAVADNGAGFPPGLAERIFEPDFTLKAGGTGLGLAVVRQAVLAHGGRVTAGARESGGAEFFVHLPAAPARNAVPDADHSNRRIPRMRSLLVAALLLLTAACAVRLGGSSPLPYRVVAVPAGAATEAADIAERIRSEGGQLALITADRDSAWFADVAARTGLELSGPGTTGPRGLAFLSSLKVLGDTSIVLLVPSGGRIHMHDALFEIDENRNLDLMLIDVVGVDDVRDGVRTLLSYIASDVGNSVPLIMGVSTPPTQVDDSVATMLRAAFANAGDCEVTEVDVVVPGLRLLYGPPARMQCDEARVLPGDAGISARLIVGR